MGKEVRTYAAITGLAALAVLAGCDGVTNTQLNFSNTEKVAITEIRVSGGSGDVTVKGSGPAGEVRIDREVRYRGKEPAKTYRLNGTVLLIDTGCGNFCHVSYEIEAPPGVAVRGGNGSGDLTLTDVAAVSMRLGSGSISVSGSSANVTVHTGSGDITVSSVAGALDADAGSGSVQARGLSRGPARVRAGSGDLDVTLGEPIDLSARTGSGEITVNVPSGRYRVKASTGSGDQEINVPNDPSGDHLIEVDSGSGDIVLNTTV